MSEAGGGMQERQSRKRQHDEKYAGIRDHGPGGPPAGGLLLLGQAHAPAPVDRRKQRQQVLVKQFALNDLVHLVEGIFQHVVAVQLIHAALQLENTRGEVTKATWHAAALLTDRLMQLHAPPEQQAHCAMLDAYPAPRPPSACSPALPSPVSCAALPLTWSAAVRRRRVCGALPAA